MLMTSWPSSSMKFGRSHSMGFTFSGTASGSTNEPMLAVSSSTIRVTVTFPIFQRPMATPL